MHLANITRKKIEPFLGIKYITQKVFRRNERKFNSEMLTPVKAVKRMPDILKMFDWAANDLYSRAVPKIRQPIEALFRWPIEK